MEESQRQAATQQQIITELRQQHQGISTTINTLVPPQPDFNMDSPEDIMSVNPFEGICSSASSSNQLPVTVLVDKIEKKEKKEPKKLSKPNDEPDDQPEQTKGRSSSKPKRLATTSPAGRPKPKRKPNKSSDNNVETTGITLNTNDDMKYWKG